MSVTCNACCVNFLVLLFSSSLFSSFGFLLLSYISSFFCIMRHRWKKPPWRCIFFWVNDVQISSLFPGIHQVCLPRPRFSEFCNTFSPSPLLGSPSFHSFAQSAFSFTHYIAHWHLALILRAPRLSSSILPSSHFPVPAAVPSPPFYTSGSGSRQLHIMLSRPHQLENDTAITPGRPRTGWESSELWTTPPTAAHG